MMQYEGLRARRANDKFQPESQQAHDESTFQFKSKGRKRLKSKLNSQAGRVLSSSLEDQPFRSIQAFN